jgi:hypothetical protein
MDFEKLSSTPEHLQDFAQIAGIEYLLMKKRNCINSKRSWAGTASIMASGPDSNLRE